jgi:3',5'-cyclic AMP phosphodiesterase CpdA
MTDATLVHLSDLHLRRRTHCLEPGCENPECQGADYRDVVEKLAAALKATDVGNLAAVLVTGDVFDSSTTDHTEAKLMLRALVSAIRDAVGAAPIAFLPGNHDRRNMGVVGPNDLTLFEAIGPGGSGRNGGADAGELPDGVQVLGTDPNFLLQRLILEGVRAIVVAYDSTFLPGGVISAGGTVRAADFLQLAAGLRPDERDLPIVMLTHHHLIPTPVTDLGPIGTEGKPWYARAIVHFAPRLFAHGDCEELWMTAFGAGTALSTLHALGRAVLVLHGHKHYPTTRLLKGTIEGDGDLILASAGSTGLAEPWMRSEEPGGGSKPAAQDVVPGVGETSDDRQASAGTRPSTPRLWPSFNVVRLTEDRVDIETVAFSLDDARKHIVRRPLVSATRAKEKWEAVPVAEPGMSEVRLVENQARYRLVQRADAADEYDLHCERVIRFAPGHTNAVVETVEGMRHGILERDGSERRLPARLELAAGTSRYVIRRAACRTLERAEAEPGYEPPVAFEWVGLPNRYGAAKVVFLVQGLPDEGTAAFGSLTDMNTGREVPVQLEPAEGGVMLIVSDCPARRLLRIYWPLVRGEQS